MWRSVSVVVIVDVALAFRWRALWLFVATKCDGVFDAVGVGSIAFRYYIFSVTVAVVIVVAGLVDGPGAAIFS